MSSIFSIGVSGLNAAKAALEVTSHNIGNVNTDGYNRQRLEQAAASPQFVGFGYVGRGVDLYAVSRMYDGFMESQLRAVTASSSGFQTQELALNDIDNLLSDPSTGLSSVMQGFYSSLQQLSQQPSSVAARQTVLSQAETVAGRFQAMNSRLEELRNGLINQVGNSVETVNAYAKQLADLNKQIVSLNEQNGRLPNDLLDQRDVIVRDLNKLIKTDSITKPDGTVDVFIGQGHPLVLSESNYEVVMTRGGTNNPEDPEAPSLNIKLPGTNNLVAVDPQLIKGGSIAGAMTTLIYDLTRVQADMGRMAIEFSDAINTQHLMGVDLNGNAATSGLFTDLSSFRTTAYAATTVGGQAKAMRDALDNFGVAIQDPAKLALSSNVVSTAATTIQPKISSIWQVGQIGGTAAANTPWTGGALNLQYNPAINPPFQADTGGPAVSVTQSPNQSGVYQFTLASGQTFAFKFEGQSATAQTIPIGTSVGSNVQLDNSNLLEMAKLQTKSLMAATPTSTTTVLPLTTDPRTASMQSFYGQMVSYVGSRTNVVQVSKQAQDAALQEVKLKKESFSGVNLDEEAANLLRYQQAYQASSKVIQAAQEMFQTLLQIA